MSDARARREALIEVYNQASICERCPLSETRNRVVFGAGNADADLMFVGEAPGAEEDRQGLPFVGRAGAFLTELLEGIGLRREDVFIANVLKCLRYNAPVQLGDGSWERIGRLVRSRYSGEVMSVDENGHLVPRCVVGWHATPVGDRRVFRLSYESAKAAGQATVNVQLTGDHPVLTERGYVRVDALLPGDRIATGQGLTALARDVVIGTVLGDGHLNAKSAHLFMGHSTKQKDYAVFKSVLLAELSPRTEELTAAAVVGGPPRYDTVHVRTIAHRSLGVLRNDFYRPEKIVPEWIAKQLNERMLAIWFMDDGYTRIRPGGREPLAEIATNGFSDADRQILLKGLSRLGLPSKALRGRLYFDVPTTKKLSEMIAPFIPPPMRYKLHPEVAEKVKFQPERLCPEERAVLFDEVVVEDVTDLPRNDKTFFCIDVEGTHNFVTAGGVVHNCRPPGNRDPQPEEIDSCRPYLEKQVELIEPRVICTLGNFATKLLTANPTGITKVRGTPQEHVIGGRPVYMLPLFHPAAGLRTPRVADQLREDCRRIPDLLARPLPEGPEPLVPATEKEPAPDQMGLFGG
ncbi:MAG TPA: uracil-DNA glycosylase family protein [Solirubrobacterales bacterium]|nr:uracil-DNA glycosylase family protein [Solirubrobacterales bacterium]